MAELAELIRDEMDARAYWYEVQAHPGKAETPEAKQAAAVLDKAKRALVAATGARNFREAKKIANYKPAFRQRSNHKSNEIV